MILIPVAVVLDQHQTQLLRPNSYPRCWRCIQWCTAGCSRPGSGYEWGHWRTAWRVGLTKALLTSARAACTVHQRLRPKTGQFWSESIRRLHQLELFLELLCHRHPLRLLEGTQTVLFRPAPSTRPAWSSWSEGAGGARRNKAFRLARQASVESWNSLRECLFRMCLE